MIKHSFLGGQYTPECTGQHTPDLHGHFKPESHGHYDRIFQLGTLPMKYRPSVELERSVSWLFNSSTGEVRTSLVKIKTNGQLVLVAHNGNYSDVLDYGQITPFQV